MLFEQNIGDLVGRVVTFCVDGPIRCGVRFLSVNRHVKSIEHQVDPVGEGLCNTGGKEQGNGIRVLHTKIARFKESCAQAHLCGNLICDSPGKDGFRAVNSF